MSIEKYRVRGVNFYKIDETITLPDGKELRIRKRKIPSKEQAEAFLSKKRIAVFEGRYFDKVEPCRLTVAEVWRLYEPISKRDNDTWRTEKGRAAHLIRHLGSRRLTDLGQGDIDFYREERLKEKTKRKTPPAPATLDREVELLKRAINYVVKCKKAPSNPLATVSLLHKANTRKVIINEEQFQEALAALEENSEDNTPVRRMRKRVFRAIVITAFDQGMRLQEVLQLKREQLFLKDGCLALGADDTKTDEGRKVYLTTRTREALEGLEEDPRCPHMVFVNPRTHRAFKDVRKLWRELKTAARLPKDAWFHDTRRSYVTNARRRNVAERVIMMQTGHKTRSTFDRYNIVDDSDQREAVKRYESGVFTSKNPSTSKNEG